jgi:SAM-dependent methyltransferase
VVPTPPIPGNPLNTPPAEDGWVDERSYWENELHGYYQRHFGLVLDPLQTDSRMLPPAGLAATIQGTNKADSDGFFASGYRTTLSYLTELRDHGASPAKMSRILEMGVGLGRLIVNFLPFGVELHGCDVTSEVLEWTRKTLGHRIRLELTRGEPPLPYPDGHFDFVYANSVFTHIDCPLIAPWAAELYRVARPGGMVIVSVLDPNNYLRHLTFREYAAKFQTPGCVAWNTDRGVMTMSYQSREFLCDSFRTAGFVVLELRQHFRDQSHLICRRDVD